MKKILLLVIIIIITSAIFVNANKYYDIQISNMNNTFILSIVNIKISEFELFEKWEIGEYAVDIISFENVILNYTYFESYELWVVEEIYEKYGIITDGEMEIIRKQEINLILPYYPKAKKIVISKMNQTTNEKTKVLEIDVSRFAKNLTITQGIEEGLDEPQEPEITEEIKPPKDHEEEKSRNYILILVTILLVLLIVFGYLLMKRRK